MSEVQGRIPLEEPGGPDPESLQHLTGRPVTMNGEPVGIVKEVEREDDGVTVTVELDASHELRFHQRADLSMFSIGPSE